MGMSTHIVGFRPPDEKFRQMAAIANACQNAGVDWPDEVSAFFEGETPDPNGVCVSLGRYSRRPSPAVTEWSNDSESGYEVDLTKLDPTIKILRFYNSW